MKINRYLRISDDCGNASDSPEMFPFNDFHKSDAIVCIFVFLLS